MDSTHCSYTDKRIHSIWTKAEKRLERVGKDADGVLSGWEIVAFGKWLVSAAFLITMQRGFTATYTHRQDGTCGDFDLPTIVIILLAFTFVADCLRMYVPMIFCSGIIPSHQDSRSLRIPQTLLMRFFFIVISSFSLFVCLAESLPSVATYFLLFSLCQLVDLVWYLPLAAHDKVIHRAVRKSHVAVQIYVQMARITHASRWAIVSFASIFMSNAAGTGRLRKLPEQVNSILQTLDDANRRYHENVVLRTQGAVTRHAAVMSRINSMISAVQNDNRFALIAIFDFIICFGVALAARCVSPAWTSSLLSAGLILHWGNIIWDYSRNGSEYLRMVAFAFGDERHSTTRPVPSAATVRRSTTDRLDQTDDSTGMGILLRRGFQSTQLARGIDLVLQARRDGARIVLCVTANVISSGMRDLVTALSQHRCIDAIVTSGGGIEEDIIKTFGEFTPGEFARPSEQGGGTDDYSIGNIVAPRTAYAQFDSWLQATFPTLDCRDSPVTPGSLAVALATARGSDDSYLVWAARHRIRLACPTLSDGALGDFLVRWKMDHPGFMVDTLREQMEFGALLSSWPCICGIVVGGGTTKHFLLNAAVPRGGLDSIVLVTTASPFDGSDSGESFDEAKSWGKLQRGAKHVLIHAEASLILPALVEFAFGIREREAPAAAPVGMDRQ